METLVMPMNYVELQEDEMMYLDGGWETYTGFNGWIKISTIISGVVGFSISAYSLAVKAAGFAATGFGVVWSVLSSLGSLGSLVSAVFNLGSVVASIFYMMRDGGFQYEDWGFWNFSWGMVKPL